MINNRTDASKADVNLLNLSAFWTDGAQEIPLTKLQNNLLNFSIIFNDYFHSIKRKGP